MMMFRSVCRVKLIVFTHQFAYNFQENDIELGIEQELICAKDTHIYTNPRYETQCFIGLAFVWCSW